MCVNDINATVVLTVLSLGDKSITSFTTIDRNLTSPSISETFIVEFYTVNDKIQTWITVRLGDTLS